MFEPTGPQVRPPIVDLGDGLYLNLNHIVAITVRSYDTQVPTPTVRAMVHTTIRDGNWAELRLTEEQTKVLMRCLGEEEE